MSLDADSLKILDSVKRGKPAHFVLLNKSMKILSVIVFRKGTVEAAVKRAKEAGTGTVCVGVVDGTGASLSFKLLQADGHEKPPVKDLVLREFVNDQNNLNVKTTIEIVETVPEVVDTDDGPTTGNAPPPRPLPNAPQTPTGGPPRPNVPPNPTSQPPGRQNVPTGNAQNPNTPRSNVPPNRPVPQVPPQQPQQVDPRKEERQTIAEHAARKVVELSQGTNLYSTAQLRAMLADCETDTTSDFGKICETLVMARCVKEDARHQPSNHGRMMTLLADAKKQAKKYIDSHKDPLVGKLLPRVLKRREHCQRFLTEIDAYEDQLQQRNAQAQLLCTNYITLLKGGKEVPYKATEELTKLLRCNLLSAETKAEIEKCCELIRNTNKALGYSAVSKLRNPTPVQKAEVFLEYGCYKNVGGGSSDVRLLQDLDGTITHAYKSMAGESGAGLAVLGVNKGGGTLREDLTSTICQAIKSSVGLDVGFPKSEVIRHDGSPGALIDGVRGKTADPDEFYRYNDPHIVEALGRQKAEEELAEAMERLQTIPDQVSSDSLQDVILCNVLTSQWDCKWGNMIVDGPTARPIDGGTAFPTKAAIQRFQTFGGLGLSNITKYPDIARLPNHGQPLPQAGQPINPQKVAAVLQINAIDLLQTAKTRRDQLLTEHPEFTADLLEDQCFEVMKDSIEAVQNILRQNPTITLTEFVAEYERWWLAWAPTQV